MRRAVQIVFISLCLGGCKRNTAADASPPPAAVSSFTRTPASTPPGAPTSSAAVPTVSNARTKGRCRARVPDEPRPIRGAGVFVTREGKIRVAVNDDGVPRFVDSVTAALKAIKSPCAAAGEALYCASKKGIISRYDSKGSAPILEGAASSLIAAARTGDVDVVAYLRAKEGPSGVIREAWARGPDGLSVKISDDGAGATAVDIVTSGDRIVFVMAEARGSLATLTIRPSSIKDGHLALAPANVVFAGGGGDYLLEPRGVVLPTGPLVVATVLPQDLHTFGSASFLVDMQRLTNVEPVWSPYPHGFDDAPFAVTLHQGAAWMVRSRPTTAESQSPMMLELGQIDPTGQFVTAGERMAPENPTHLALASDRDALVIYVDGDKGGLRERWACGQAR